VSALDALVTREQVRFKQTPKTVCAAHWIPDKIRRREFQQATENVRRRNAVAVRAKQNAAGDAENCHVQQPMLRQTVGCCTAYLVVSEVEVVGVAGDRIEQHLSAHRLGRLDYELLRFVNLVAKHVPVHLHFSTVTNSLTQVCNRRQTVF